MGRPLNKKYFGNRNTGSASVTTDNSIGGGAVASVTLNALGAYTTRPTIGFSAPTIPGGVTATGTITSEVVSAAVSGSQTRAYPTAAAAIGFNTAGSTFTATVTSAALTTVVRASATTIGFAAASANVAVSGNSIHITGASITGTMTIGGVAIANGQIYYTGAPSTTTSATLYATYADAVSATSPLTIGVGTVTGATFTHGVTFGVVTALTPVARGSYEALVASGAAVVATAGVGAGLVITPTYRAKAVVVTEAGSGYVAAPTPTFTQSVTATSVNMLVDSGVISTTGNQENAIVMTAFLTGGSATTVDIIRQVSGRRYKVTDGTRTTNGTTIPHVELQSTLANAAGECSIAATDSAGGEYFVTKLTARKATVTRAGGSGWLYATGQAAPWKFDTAAGIYLQIANA